MAFKMKGSAFKSGGIQGTSGYSSALKQKQEQDSALQCRMYNKTNQFRMKSPLEQSCPPGTVPVELDENGNPIQMKASAFKQYPREELEDYTYVESEPVTDPETGVTTYTKKGTKPGESGGGTGKSYLDAWNNMSNEEQAKYGDFRRFEAEASAYNEGSPDLTDEMSYTTKPQKTSVSLDPIPVSLPPTELPGPEKVKIPNRVKNPKKKKTTKKRNRRSTGEFIEDFIIPGTKTGRKNWRIKAGRKLNPKNWFKGGMGCQGVQRTNKRGKRR